MNPDRAARLHGAVDAHAGEPFLFQARRYVGGDPNARPEADPSRESQIVGGIFAAAGRRIHPDARKMSADGAQQVSVPRPTVKCAAAGFAWRPGRPDLATRVLTGDVFAVSVAQPDGFGRLVISLTGQS